MVQGYAVFDQAAGALLTQCRLLEGLPIRHAH
jgi:hypothetical protein